MKPASVVNVLPMKCSTDVGDDYDDHKWWGLEIAFIQDATFTLKEGHHLVTILIRDILVTSIQSGQNVFFFQMYPIWQFFLNHTFSYKCENIVSQQCKQTDNMFSTMKPICIL